jgi:hypothetical protein
MVGKAAVLSIGMLQTSERKLDNPWELAYAPTIIREVYSQLIEKKALRRYRKLATSSM